MKRERLERLLPAIFQSTLRSGSPLLALLEVMEMLHEPSENVLRQLDIYFDPRRTPDAFVAYLARWVDLGVLFEQTALGRRSPAVPISTGLGRLRELVAVSAELSKWRGTQRGLVTFLETATGTQGFEVDERVQDKNGRTVPAHFRVVAPSRTVAHRSLIERIIELEKPAYITYELSFRQD
jgi:phage tail-like protein